MQITNNHDNIYFIPFFKKQKILEFHNYHKTNKLGKITFALMGRIPALTY